MNFHFFAEELGGSSILMHTESSRFLDQHVFDQWNAVQETRE